VLHQTTSCRVARVPEEYADSVVVAHCFGSHWNPLGERVGWRKVARAEKIEHEVLCMNCKSVEAPGVKGC
jgi:hypothetical protein